MKKNTSSIEKTTSSRSSNVSPPPHDDEEKHDYMASLLDTNTMADTVLIVRTSFLP